MFTFIINWNLICPSLFEDAFDFGSQKSIWFRIIQLFHENSIFLN